MAKKLKERYIPQGDGTVPCDQMINVKPVKRVCKRKPGASDYNWCCCRTNGLAIKPNHTGSVCNPLISGDDKPCFASNTHAQLANGSNVLMSELRAGDIVLDGPASTTRVMVNQHHGVDLQSEFVTLKLSSGSLSLTPDHVLEIDGSMAPAREAVVGSKLRKMHGNEFVNDQVQRVTFSRGAAINPITSSGKIIANGVLASTFPEWIADWMLSTAIVPVPCSFIYILAYRFRDTLQAYYDTLLEPFFQRTAGALVQLKAATPSPLVFLAFVLADIAASTGFIMYSLVSNLDVVAALAAVAFAAKAMRAKNKTK